MNTRALSFESLRAGLQLPIRRLECGNVQQMLYNAVLWNAHRIHFDLPYATEVEGYPGLVVAGPLLGDWLHQCVDEWLGDLGTIFSIDYSNRLACYVNDVLYSGGVISKIRSSERLVEIDVFIKNEANDVVAPGQIVARFDDV